MAESEIQLPIMEAPIIIKERKKKTLTIEKKLELINDYQKNGLNQRLLAEKYEIGQATVSDIIKKKSLYEEGFAKGNAKFKQLKRAGKYCDLNESLFKFVEITKKNSTPLSANLLRTKASQIAIEMGLEGFRCSDGWLNSFKRRYNITYGVCTERVIRENVSSSEECINVDEASETMMEAQCLFDNPVLIKVDETRQFRLRSTSYNTEEIVLISDSESEPEIIIPLLEAKNALLVLQKFCDQSGFDRNISLFKAGYMIDELISKQNLEKKNQPEIAMCSTSSLSSHHENRPTV